MAVGKPLSECLAHSSLVPPTVVQMVHAGEESGRLSEILGHLAEYLEALMSTSRSKGLLVLWNQS